MTLNEFAARYGADARALQAKYKFNAAVALAIASWESNYGTSRLTQDNNLFGLKAGMSSPHWNGARRPAPDGGSYRTYPNSGLSFLDFGYLMENAARYRGLADLSNRNLDQFALQFVNSGYMTGAKDNYRRAIIDRAPKFQAVLGLQPTAPNWAEIAGYTLLAMAGAFALKKAFS